MTNAWRGAPRWIGVRDGPLLCRLVLHVALDIDWKEQAVRSAEKYLETMPFPRTS